MSKATQNIRAVAKSTLPHIDAEKEVTALNLLHAIFWIGQALEGIENRLSEIERRLDHQTNGGMLRRRAWAVSSARANDGIEHRGAATG